MGKSERKVLCHPEPADHDAVRVEVDALRQAQGKQNSGIVKKL